MNETFAENVYPVISYVLDLLDDMRGPEAKQPARSEVFPRLKQVLGGMQAEGTERKPLELAKQALVYWVDEVLVNSEWSQANEWQNNLLERELYDTRDRAWKFFDAAKSARTMGRSDALETFYICVALGFRGLYRGKGNTPLPPKTADEEKKKKPIDMSMSWFGEASGFNPEETWGLGQLPKMTTDESLLDNSLMPNVVGGEENAYGLPRTLEEWAGPVFAQVAPPVTENFVPSQTGERQRDARPLRGRLALRRSLRILAVSSVVTIGLFLMWMLVG